MASRPDGVTAKAWVSPQCMRQSNDHHDRLLPRCSRRCQPRINQGHGRGSHAIRPSPRQIRGNGGPPPSDLPTNGDDQSEPINPQDGSPQPPDRTNAERLIRWADPTKTLNIAQEILDDLESFPDGESLLGQIGQRVVR